MAIELTGEHVVSLAGSAVALLTAIGGMVKSRSDRRRGMADNRWLTKVKSHIGSVMRPVSREIKVLAADVVEQLTNEGKTHAEVNVKDNYIKRYTYKSFKQELKEGITEAGKEVSRHIYECVTTDKIEKVGSVYEYKNELTKRVYTLFFLELMKQVGRCSEIDDLKMCVSEELFANAVSAIFHFAERTK